MTKTSLLSFAILVGVGCAEAAPPLATVRDSSGVRIVSNGMNTGAQWHAELAVSIGEVDGADEYMFFQLTDMTRVSDGQIAVLNSSTAEVRLYDATGRHLRTAGGRGSGPGEFRFPSIIQRRTDDTVLVWNAPSGPATVFSSFGDFVRTESYDPGAMMTSVAEYGGWHGAELLPDGSFVIGLLEREPDIGRTGLYRPPEGVAWVNRTLDTAALIAWYPGIEQLNVGTREQPQFLVPPHGVSSHRSVGGQPARVLIGDSGENAVRLYDLNGTLRLIIEDIGSGAPITDADRARWEETTRERMLRRADEAQVNRWLADVPTPSHKPPFSSMLLGENGELWVRGYPESPDSSVAHAVFGLDGVRIATVNLPGRFSAVEIGEDYILGRVRDADGVEFVQLFELRR